jgi:hypothetical protein
VKCGQPTARILPTNGSRVFSLAGSAKAINSILYIAKKSINHQEH